MYSIAIMKIATWNINSVRARIDQLLHWLVDSSLDIALLQEIKCINEVFPTEMLNDTGYNSAICGQKSYNGVAILSKYIIDDIITWQDITDDSQARYIEVFTGGINVASVYVPNGVAPDTQQYEYKLHFFDVLLKHISNKSNFVIGGDFNVTVDDNDVYNPAAWRGKICCTDKEREKMKNLFDSGLSDITRILKKKKKIYTWWNYMAGCFNKDYGLRLDYMLTTKDLAVSSAIVNKQVRGNQRPSDHAPVEIIL